MNILEFNKESYVDRIHTVLEQNGILPSEFSNDESLDLDSLTQISLLVCFENEFGFEFSDEDLSNVPTTYNGIVQFVLKNIVRQVEDDDATTILCEGGGLDEETT